MDVVIGLYRDNRVVAWRLGRNPLEVVYDEQGYLTPARAELEQQGYQVALVIEELNATNILVMVEE
jgi:hypothetical protein